VGLVTLAPLRHPPFRRFWIGAALSNIGTWMETVALGYYVADQTRLAVWSAVIAAAGFVPIAVIGPIGGALADRRSRKVILLVTMSAQALVATAITVLVAVDSAGPAVIALLTLLSGCAAAIGFPSYQASFRHLVPPEDLPAAIGLSSAQWNLGRILGPVAAAVAIGIGGISWALAINSLSFLAVIVAVASVHLPRPPRGAAHEPFRRAILGGWHHVRAEAGLRATFTIMCLNTFLAAPFIALIPAMAVKVLDGNEATTGVLVTAQGVGAVVAGAVIGGLVARYGVRVTMVRAVGLLAPSLAVYGLAPTVVTMAMALAVLGFLYMLALSTFTTVAQQRSPDELTGRVLAVNNAVLGALYPVGALLQGRLGDVIGLRATTVLAGAALAAALVAVRAVRPHFTSALEHPVAPVPAA
jgi:MFS family permease